MSAFSESKFAWEPVTPRGVAAFARASFGRLLVVQSFCALLAVGALVWLLADGFFPTVDAAIRRLPSTGDISHGRLHWLRDSPQMLAEGHFLAFSVDLKHSGLLRSPAQFQFEFGENSIVIYSLFGESEIVYPPDQAFYFDRVDVQPIWGAWSPEILGIVAVAVFFGLLLVWGLLATLYFLPVYSICFYANRDLNFRQSWRLAGAALMPGALLLTLAIVLYGVGVFDVVQFCFAFIMHLVVGWIYLFVSPMFLQRSLPSPRKNPFANKK